MRNVHAPRARNRGRLAAPVLGPEINQPEQKTNPHLKEIAHLVYCESIFLGTRVLNSQQLSVTINLVHIRGRLAAPESGPISNAAKQKSTCLLSARHQLCFPKHFLGKSNASWCRVP